MQTARGNGKDSEAVARRCIELLDLSRNDLFVALGATDPVCFLRILELVPLDFQLVVVDPSDQRLLPLKGIPTLRAVQMDPLDFAMFPLQVEKILVDDDVVLGDGSDKVFARLFDRMPQGGRLLVVERVPVTTNLAEGSSPMAPNGCEIEERLQKVGFEVQREALTSARGPFDLILATKGLNP
ncbi:MAG TPA: hypothetical protein DEP35_16865 [Deltaproteobacteria bacterium]|nr:hypothetical protein [Deltaproteobacteria bacterium]